MDLTLIFAGAVVTALVEVLKRYVNMNRSFTLLVVAGLSLIGGAGFYYLQNAGLVDASLKIVGSAAVIYAFIVKSIQA